MCRNPPPPYCSEILHNSKLCFCKFFNLNSASFPNKQWVTFLKYLCELTVSRIIPYIILLFSPNRFDHWIMELRGENLLPWPIYKPYFFLDQSNISGTSYKVYCLLCYPSKKVLSTSRCSASNLLRHMRVSQFFSFFLI